MNTQTLIAGLLVALAVTAYLAAQGSIAAMVALAILTTIALVLVGAGITLFAVKMMLAKQQADFIANTKENLAIMQSMQNIQNSQNAHLLKQQAHLAKHQGALPPPSNGNILIPDAIFDDLEQ